jgi:hypothetical protein
VLLLAWVAREHVIQHHSAANDLRECDEHLEQSRDNPGLSLVRLRSLGRARIRRPHLKAQHSVTKAQRRTRRRRGPPIRRPRAT